MNETVDTIARELITAWPEWEKTASMVAQHEENDEAASIVLFDYVTTFLARSACRVRGHAEPVWYNVNGLEPDMHCRCCGEDLG